MRIDAFKTTAIDHSAISPREFAPEFARFRPAEPLLRPCVTGCVTVARFRALARAIVARDYLVSLNGVPLRFGPAGPATGLDQVGSG